MNPKTKNGITFFIISNDHTCKRRCLVGGVSSLSIGDRAADVVSVRMFYQMHEVHSIPTFLFNETEWWICIYAYVLNRRAYDVVLFVFCYS